MDAIISGQAKTALIIDGSAMMSFDLDSPLDFVARTDNDLRYLFEGATDLRRIENTDHETVKVELFKDYDRNCLLDLALLLLDHSSGASRGDLADALEDYLSDTAWITYLEAIFYSKPLPDIADITGAIQICRNSYPNVFEWLSNLATNQYRISKVEEIWNSIPIAIFVTEENREHARKVFAQEGFFRELVLGCDDPVKVNKINFNIISNKSAKQLPSIIAIAQHLISPFKKRLDIGESIVEKIDSRKSADSPRHFGGLNRFAILQQVNLKKDRIITLLHQNLLSDANNEVESLIEYQESNGERIHIIKSLCDLAQNAKELGLFKFQLSLTEKAVYRDYSDAWTQAQHGDALLRNNKLKEAMVAFENAIRLPKPSDDRETTIVAKNGYAEVLKARGDLAGAEEMYRTVMNDHPDDVVAKNGYAEVLKARGDLAGAEEIYQTVLNDHPDDVVAKNGYAEVLKARGDLAGAEEMYKTAINDHPENVVAKNGYAEVLKARGDLAGAEEMYRTAINDHPENVVAKTGYAEVLKARGDLASAEEVYKTVMHNHPENVVAKNGYAEVLKAWGDLAGAEEMYKTAISDHPENVVAKNGYAEVLKARGDLAGAEEMYKTTMNDHPENVVAKNGYAEVLKARGDLAGAEEMYNSIMKDRPGDVVAKNGYAEVLKARGDLAGAEEMYKTAMNDHPENVVAKNGYAEVLKARGDLAGAEEMYKTAMNDHPGDAVAKTGYAEVLKARGDLAGAEETYKAVMKEHPEDMVAKTGFASVLFAAGKLEEALNELPVEQLIASNNWIGYHLRGMILIKKGDLEEAARIFEKGEKEDLLASSRAYFRTALALVRLKQKEFLAAASLLENVTEPVIRAKANIFLIHAFGELKSFDKAKMAFHKYHVDAGSNVIAGPWKKNEIELVTELDNRYVSLKGAKQTDQWVDERELEILSLAA